MSSYNNIWKRSTKPTHLTILKKKFVNDWRDCGRYLSKKFDDEGLDGYLRLKHLIDTNVLNAVSRTKNSTNNAFRRRMTKFSDWSYLLDENNTKQNEKLIHYWSKQCTEMLYDLDYMDNYVELNIILIHFFVKLNEITVPMDDEVLISTLSLNSDVILVLAANVWGVINTEVLQEYDRTAVYNSLYKAWYYGNIFFRNCLLSRHKWNYCTDIRVAREIILRAPTATLIGNWFVRPANAHWYCGAEQQQQLIQLVSTDDRVQKYVQDIFKLLTSNNKAKQAWNDLFESVSSISMKNDFIEERSNDTKVSPVTFVYQDAMNMAKYKNTHLFNASSTEVRIKVGNFIQNELANSNTLIKLSFDITEAIIKNDYAGIVAVSFVDQCISSLLNPRGQFIYGCMIAHFAYLYNLPAKSALILTILGITDATFMVYLKVMQRGQLLKYPIFYWTNVHCLLKSAIISLYNSNMNGTIKQCNWWDPLKVVISKFEWSLDCELQNMVYGLYNFLTHVDSLLQICNNASKDDKKENENSEDKGKFLTKNECFKLIFVSDEQQNQFVEKILSNTKLNHSFKIPSHCIHPKWQHCKFAIMPAIQSDNDIKENDFSSCLFLPTKVRESEDEADSSHSDTNESESIKKTESDSDNSDNSHTTANAHHSQQKDIDDSKESKSNELYNVFREIQYNKSMALQYSGSVYAASIVAYSDIDNMSVASHMTSRTVASSIAVHFQPHEIDSKMPEKDIVVLKMNKPWIKYPTIDLKNVHANLIAAVDYTADPLPTWINDNEYSFNKLYCYTNEVLAIFDQYHITPTGDHSHNRDIHTLPLWTTSITMRNNCLQFGGPLGYYPMRAHYLNRLGNTDNSFIFVEDGLMKCKGSNFFNIIQETLHQHVNVIHQFFPRWIEYNFQQKRMPMMELTFLETITSDQLIDWSYRNKLTLDKIKNIEHQQNVYNRKISCHYWFLNFMRVCIYLSLVHIHCYVM